MIYLQLYYIIFIIRLQLYYIYYMLTVIFKIQVWKSDLNYTQWGQGLSSLPPSTAPDENFWFVTWFCTYISLHYDSRQIGTAEETAEWYTAYVKPWPLRPHSRCDLHVITRDRALVWMGRTVRGGRWKSSGSVSNGKWAVRQDMWHVRSG